MTCLIGWQITIGFHQVGQSKLSDVLFIRSYLAEFPQFSPEFDSWVRWKPSWLDITLQLKAIRHSKTQILNYLFLLLNEFEGEIQLLGPFRFLYFEFSL